MKPPAAGTPRTACSTQDSIGRPATSCSSLMRLDLILLPMPAARMSVYRGRLLPRTGFLGLHELDELVLVPDPVEVRIALRVDPVLLVQADGLLQRGDRARLVAGERVGGGDPVVDHVAAGVLLQRLLEFLQRRVRIGAIQ